MRIRLGLNLATAAALTAVLLFVAAPVRAQHEQPAAGAAQSEAPGAHGAQAEGHGAEESHGNPILDMVARLFNFAILAGTLVYFLKSPAAQYLRDRGTQIRSDLVKAADMRSSAAAQLAAVERQMAALPAELDALRTAGAEETAAEEARIRQAAERERERLREQARHEIETQLKIAQRDLVRSTADLAVAIAAARVEATITAADQSRLVDRYLGQIGRAPAADGQVSA